MHTLRGGGAEDSLRSVYVCLDCLSRMLHDELDTHCCRKVHNHISAIHELGQERAVEYRADYIRKARVRPQVHEVSQRPGGEIVDDGYAPALSDRTVGEVGPDEA